MISLDTNIFVYLLDDASPEKQAVAADVISRAATVNAPVALQVIGEAQNVARRKLKAPPFVAAQFARNIMTAFAPLPASVEDAETALGQMAAGHLSYWDALLVACLRRNGCSALITEDMQDGATVLGVEIVNPFHDGRISDRARHLLFAKEGQP